MSDQRRDIGKALCCEIGHRPNRIACRLPERAQWTQYFFSVSKIALETYVDHHNRRLRIGRVRQEAAADFDNHVEAVRRTRHVLPQESEQCSSLG